MKFLLSIFTVLISFLHFITSFQNFDLCIVSLKIGNLYSALPIIFIICKRKTSEKYKYIYKKLRTYTNKVEVITKIITENEK